MGITDVMFAGRNNALGDIITADAGDNYLRGLSGDDVLNALGGNDRLFGQAGNDTLVGGAGNDSRDGGAGIDIANYSGAATITWTGSAWTAGNATEGTDTLTGVEGIDGNGPGGPITWLVGGGGFTTIDAAIAAASAGDTILVGSGDYAGFTLSKAVTINGQNAGIDGTGTRVAETNITTASSVTVATGTANIDGLTFRYSGPTQTAYVALDLFGGSTLRVENSRFFSDVANGGPGARR